MRDSGTPDILSEIKRYIIRPLYPLALNKSIERLLFYVSGTLDQDENINKINHLAEATLSRSIVFNN